MCFLFRHDHVLAGESDRLYRFHQVWASHYTVTRIGKSSRFDWIPGIRDRKMGELPKVGQPGSTFGKSRAVARVLGLVVVNQGGGSGVKIGISAV